METVSARSPVISGSLWMFGMVLSLSAIAIGGRELASVMTPFEMVFFRALLSMLVLVPFVLRHHGGFPSTNRLPLHIIRNFAHYCGQSAWFYGITLLPLAKVFAIEFSTPIWTLLLAAVFIGEKITRWRLLALVLGLTGVLIVLRPGFVPINFASIVVLCSAFFFSMSHIYTRRITQHETPLHVLFYMSLVQVPLAVIPALYGWVWPAGTAWLWLMLLAACSISAHYCLSRALTIADASIMIPVDFLRLPLIVLVGYLFYQEPLDWFV